MLTASSDTPQKTLRPEYPPSCAVTIAPAMGLPNSVPKEENAYSVPTRKPSVRTSDIEATKAGIMARVRPEAKP